MAARMTVDELRDVIVRSKRASIDKIVTDAMSRDLLKEKFQGPAPARTRFDCVQPARCGDSVPRSCALVAFLN